MADNVENLESVIATLDERLQNIDRQAQALNDSVVQSREAARGIKDFAARVIDHVHENDDLELANKTLIDALLEINRYSANRPVAILHNKFLLTGRRDAYSECRSICQEVLDNEKSSDDDVAGAFERIMTRLDDEGNFPPRQFGDRPEKLREIRRVQEELEAEDILEEDI